MSPRIEGITVQRCAEYMAKLKWLDTQPKPQIGVTDEDEYKSQKKAANSLRSRVTRFNPNN